MDAQQLQTAVNPYWIELMQYVAALSLQTTERQHTATMSGDGGGKETRETRVVQPLCLFVSRDRETCAPDNKIVHIGTV
jgi:hypothetical protein